MPLAYVIWGIGLLSYIAVSLLWSGNVSYQLARNVTEAAQLEATVEATINRAVLGLLDGRYDRRWRVDGVAQEFSFGGAKVRVAIQDELGRIDLNHADGALLAGLFQSVGLDSFSASRRVDKILDWRDSNGLKRLNGATAQDYRAAGFAYGPRNGPFQSVDELKLVMDMTPELFRRVEPALTVYSGSNRLVLFRHARRRDRSDRPPARAGFHHPGRYRQISRHAVPRNSSPYHR